MKRRNHRPDWRRIKSLRSYTIEETARLLQVHRNAVRYWIKGGLPVLTDQRPHLIHGGDLAVFLRERRQAKKQTCGPGRFFCMKCRHPRPPADGMVDYKPITSARGILLAICPVCETMMYRFTSQARLVAITPYFSIQTADR